MESRMEKYNNELPRYNRLQKNKELYKEVYGSYANLENLPISNNTNEINIEDLREIVNENRNKRSNIYEKEEILKTNREIETKKEYDINKLLERAKNEKHQESYKQENKIVGSNYLLSLESDESKINKIRQEIQKINKDDLKEEVLNNDIEQPKDNLYMTRELKFKDKSIEVDNSIEMMSTTNNKEDNLEEEISPLDLLSDLKPSGNSFIVEPIKTEKENIFATEEDSAIDEDIPKLENTNRIGLKEIKEKVEEDDEDSNFYTSRYKFSKRDFDKDDDDEESSSKLSNILKVFLLLILIIILAIGIYYFISKYGVGA